MDAESPIDANKISALFLNTSSLPPSSIFLKIQARTKKRLFRVI